MAGVCHPEIQNGSISRKEIWGTNAHFKEKVPISRKYLGITVSNFVLKSGFSSEYFGFDQYTFFFIRKRFIRKWGYRGRKFKKVEG